MCLREEADNDARGVPKSPGMQNARLVRPADDHHGRVLIGFDQLNRQAVGRGYLASGQLSNLGIGTRF